MKKIIKRIGLAILGFIVLVIVGFFMWIGSPFQADPGKLGIATAETKNDFRIAEKNDYWEITPNNPDAQEGTYKDAGLIFYPGAKVEPQAYFYKLSPLANGESGRIRVFVTKPTFNLALFGISQPEQVMKDHPEVKRWIIGGHSLGGAIACEYARIRPENISELWLFGAYCGSDITGSNLKVASIHGSLDGILTPEMLADYRKNLPANALDYVIDGMNHGQLGNYGEQTGDKQPTKTDEEVRQEMVEIYSEILSK